MNCANLNPHKLGKAEVISMYPLHACQKTEECRINSGQITLRCVKPCVKSHRAKEEESEAAHHLTVSPSQYRLTDQILPLSTCWQAPFCIFSNFFSWSINRIERKKWRHNVATDARGPEYKRHIFFQMQPIPLKCLKTISPKIQHLSRIYCGSHLVCKTFPPKAEFALQNQLCFFK